MPAKLDIRPGDKYGRYTIIREVLPHKKHRRFLCECQCGTIKEVPLSALKSGSSKSCGCYMREVFTRDRSTHGASKTRLYQIWLGIKKRCYNTRCRAYRWYGAQGITLCPEWQIFEDFRAWALSNGYKDNLTIERKDNKKNYDPNNCIWIPWSKQPLNKRGTIKIFVRGIEFDSIGSAARHFNMPAPTVYNRLKSGLSMEEVFERRSIKEGANNRKSTRFVEYDGKRMSIADWGRTVGIEASAIRHRLDSGWSVEKALTTPVRGK